MLISFKLIFFFCTCLSLKAEACLKGKQLLSSERWKEISVESVLVRAPELKDNVQPIQMAQLINRIPLSIREVLQMTVITVIDGSVSKIERFKGGSMNHVDTLLIQNFINQFSSELSVKDLYYVMYERDQVHYDTVKSKMASYEYKETLHQIAYDHACNLILQLPAIRMSIDLGDGLLEHNHFLIPDSYMLYGFRPGDNDEQSIRHSGLWESKLKQAKEASKNIPWELKVPKVFWRGIDSGKAYGVANEEVWADLPRYYPRVELARLSAKHPDQIDAMLTHHNDDPNEVARYVALGMEDRLTSKWFSITDHVKFKYLISLDGWTAAWMRVPWIMATNSLLIKQETLKVEWFDYALKPYVHYYPVKRDLSDLLEAIDYLEKHQEEAQEIIRNANRFVQEYFTREKITEAAKRVFRDYAQIQNYTFNQVERQLILQWNQPYYTFAQLPFWRREELLRSLQQERKIRWLSYGAALSFLAALVCWMKQRAKSRTAYLRQQPLKSQQTQKTDRNPLKVDTGETIPQRP